MPYPMPDSPLFAHVARAIDPRCEMYAFAVRSSGEEQAQRYYFHSAEFLVERLMRVIEGGGRDPADLALLDFAGGYGRFTRFFVPLFRRVAMADLDPGMIEFCRRELGAKAFLSSTDPAAIEARPDYDVVFVFSLFTHLPESSWKRWLQLLWNFVAPGGFFVFSTRSPALGQRMDAAYTVGGTQKSVLELPHQPLQQRMLHIYGIRVSVQAESGERVEGTLRIGARITGPPLRAGAVRFDESYPRGGLQLGAATPSITAEGASQLLAIEIPFVCDGALSDFPLGGIGVPLDFERAAPALVEECAGSPTLELQRRTGRDDGGIRFRATNETSGRLDPQSYGSTTVTTAFVNAAVAELEGASPPEQFPGGQMDLFQDVFVVRKAPAAT
jgi:SAM-dependent methyltransferase